LEVRDPGTVTRKGTLATFLILMIAVLIPFTLMMAPYFLAILMGGILSAILYPFYLRLLERGWGPKTASTSLVVALTVLVLAPMTLCVLGAVRQTANLANHLNGIEGLDLESAIAKVLEWEFLHDFLGDPNEIIMRLRELSSAVLKVASELVFSFAASIPELLLQLGLGLFACLFFLLDGKEFVTWIGEKTPLSRQIRELMFTSFRNTAMSVILATVAAAGVQGAIMSFAFLVLGVPAALLAGAATFLFAWVPMLGAFPVVAAGALYLYVQGSLAKLAVMVFFGVVTSVADNIVRPVVLSGRNEIHPLVSIVAIFGGISMIGILGVFIGPILAAMVIVVLNTWPAVAHQAGIALGDSSGNAGETATDSAEAAAGG